MTDENKVNVISRTALAGLRSYVDAGMPYVNEFWDAAVEAKGAKVSTSIFNPDEHIPPQDLVRRETHCRAMEAVLRKAIEQRGIGTYLEYAAGIAPR